MDQVFKRLGISFRGDLHDATGPLLPEFPFFEGMAAHARPNLRHPILKTVPNHSKLFKKHEKYAKRSLHRS